MNYHVKKIDWEQARTLKSRTARDGVSTKQSKSPTQWFGAFTEDEKLVGICGVMDMGGRARLKSLWVDPEHRRRGIRELLNVERMRYVEEDLMASEVNGWTREHVKYWQDRWGLQPNGSVNNSGAYFISKTL